MMERNKTYDVIIVGAGPSGTTAARNIARGGYKVLLIDKAQFPRDKICGGLVPAKALQALDFDIPSSHIKNKITRISLYNKKLDCSTYESNQSLGITISRIDLDNYLLDRALDQGAIFHQNTKFQHLERDGNDIKLFTSNGIYSCKILIGSDGVFSRVKNYVYNSKIDQYRMGFTLSGYVNVENSGDNNDFKLFDIPISLSMGWAIPLGEKINIGIGGPLFKKEQLKRAFGKYMNRIQPLYPFHGESIQIRGGVLPAGGFRRKIYKNGMLLTGDAAGFADPLTGEGIYYAIRSGAIAAQQIINGTLDKYEESCYDEFQNKLRKSLAWNLLGINKACTVVEPLRSKMCLGYLKTMEG